MTWMFWRGADAAKAWRSAAPGACRTSAKTVLSGRAESCLTKPSCSGDTCSRAIASREGGGGGERVSVSGFEDYGDRKEEARTPMPRDAPVTAYEGIVCGLCRGLCAESSAVSCTTGQYRTLLLYLGVECRCTQY